MPVLRAVLLVLLLAGTAGCCKEERIPGFVRDLYSPTAKRRNEAALGLAHCSGPAVERAVPRLIDLMYDDNIGVQSSAAYALRKIDTPRARDALERARARKLGGGKD